MGLECVEDIEKSALGAPRPMVERIAVIHHWTATNGADGVPDCEYKKKLGRGWTMDRVLPHVPWADGLANPIE